MNNPTLRLLATKVSEQLRLKNRILTLVESCTGGMASAYITEVPGSSAWFDSGIITYSNQAKIDLVNVSNHTLNLHGAVSEHTAAAMAIGALFQNRANLTASITGIAGPTGGSPEKPIGTVCFAWAGTNLPLTTKTLHFSGDRHSIRQQAIQTAFKGILELLNTHLN